MPVPYVVNDVTPWTQAVAGSAQYVFSTNWTANATTDVLVYNRLPAVPANDILQLVDPSLYTVAFVGGGNIVEVTFITAPLQYNIITIIRATPSDFLNTYTNTNFIPSMLNGDFERLTLIDQQNQLMATQYAPHYNSSASVILQDPVAGVGGDEILPILGANQIWMKKSDNTQIIPVTLTSDILAGIINPADQYSIAYYANDGSEISGLNVIPSSILTTDVDGIPSLTQTLPIAVQNNITELLGMTGYLQAPLGIKDVNGNLITGFSYVSSAVNYLTLQNAATGNGPLLIANGSDSVIPVGLQSKGGAALFFETAATGTNPSIAFLTGTGYQHGTNFIFPDTAFSRQVTFPDATGTVAFTSEIPNITVGGATVFSGAHTFTATITANTNVTFPTSGTLATTTANVQTSVTQLIPSTGTYTPTAGMVYCKVTASGAGGGGGSSVGGVGASAGAGGGSGEIRVGYFSAAAIGASQAITIGAAGLAGTAAGAGGTGGSTLFGALITANGGIGGAAMGNVSGNGICSIGGSGGGSGSGADYGIPGNCGYSGIAAGSSTLATSGGGAGSPLFGGGSIPVSANTAGNAGFSSGAGGSGGASSTTSKNGGAGGAGVVIIEEFIAS